MESNLLIDNAKVMSKGQITIPKEFRLKLGLQSGDRVTLVYKDGHVMMLNAAMSAMQLFQKEMAGVGVFSEAEIQGWVDEVR